MKTCKVEGCNNKHKAKGYCQKHYQQLLRHGETSERTIFTPNKIIKNVDYAEVVLYNKQCEEVARALIDLDDIDKVKEHKWNLSHGYVRSKKNSMFLHRFIMDCPDDMVVDHINHNKLDNRKENLRVCTQHQNSMNKSMCSNNTSGVIGVYLDKSNNKWYAQIHRNKKCVNLGSFDTIEEATEARKLAELEIYGEYRNKEDED